MEQNSRGTIGASGYMVDVNSTDPAQISSILHLKKVHEQLVFALKTEIDVLKKANGGLRSQVSFITKKDQELKDSLQELIGDNEVLQEQLNSQKSIERQLKETITGCMSMIEIKNSEMEKSRAENQELLERLHEFKKINQKLAIESANNHSNPSNNPLFTASTINDVEKGHINKKMLFMNSVDLISQLEKSIEGIENIHRNIDTIAETKLIENQTRINILVDPEHTEPGNTNFIEIAKVHDWINQKNSIISKLQTELGSKQARIDELKTMWEEQETVIDQKSTQIEQLLKAKYFHLSGVKSKENPAAGPSDNNSSYFEENFVTRAPEDEENQEQEPQKKPKPDRFSQILLEKNKKLEAKLQRNEEEKQRLIKTVEDLKKNIIDAEKVDGLVKKHEVDMSNHNSNKLKRISDDLEKARAKISQFEIENQNFAKENENLKQTINKFELKLEESSKEIQNKDKTISISNLNVKRLEKREKILQEKAEKAEADNQKELNNLKQQIFALEKKCKILTESKEKLENEMQAKEENKKSNKLKQNFEKKEEKPEKKEEKEEKDVEINFEIMKENSKLKKNIKEHSELIENLKSIVEKQQQQIEMDKKSMVPKAQYLKVLSEKKKTLADIEEKEKKQQNEKKPGTAEKRNENFLKILKQNQDLTKKLSILRAEKEKFEQFEIQKNFLEKQIEGYVKEISDLNSVKQQNTNLSIQNTNFSKQISELQKEIEENKKLGISSLKTQNREKETQKIEPKTEITNGNEKDFKDRLKKEMEATEKEFHQVLAQLKEKNENLEKETLFLREKLATSALDNKNLSNVNQDLPEKLNRLNKEKEVLMEQVDSIRKENEELKFELDQFDEEFWEEIEDLKFNYDKVLKENVELKKKIST